ncbi:MAG: hypothetical protein V4721_06525 [Bacteroidota bacterium]
MEKNQQQNHFNNPVVIILFIALVGLGGYFLFSKNQNDSQVKPDTSQEQIDNLKKELDALKQNGSTNTKPSTTTAKEKSTAEITKEWSPRIAHIACTNDNINYSLGSGTFTEFVKGSPIILTNAHVVTLNGYVYSSCGFTLTGNEQVYILDTSSFSGSPQDVEYILTSSSAYLNPNIIMPNKGEMRVCKAPGAIGDKIVILGYPAAGGTGGSITATDGIISSFDQQYYVTSAKIDHGNSGGAAILVKDDCYLGIPTWAESGGFESYGRILSQSYFLGHEPGDVLR